MLKCTNIQEGEYVAFMFLNKINRWTKSGVISISSSLYTAAVKKRIVPVNDFFKSPYGPYVFAS